MNDGTAAMLRSWEERASLVSRLRSEDEDDLAAKLAECGSPFSLTCTCCGQIKQVHAACKRKWCPVCARRIAAARVARYNAAVDAMQWPLFITLTMRNVNDLSIEHLRKLRRAFGKLRKQGWWSKVVKGGVASVEVTNIGNGWHPHLHGVIDCRWLAVKTPPPKPFETRKQLLARFQQAASEVERRWAKCLGQDTASIKIKRAYSESMIGEHTGKSETIAREVLKYSVKAGDLLKCEEPIGDLIRLLERCRLVTSWGSCYGKRLTVPDEVREYTPCEGCGTKQSWIPTIVVDRWQASTRHNSRRIGVRR